MYGLSSLSHGIIDFFSFKYHSFWWHEKRKQDGRYMGLIIFGFRHMF